MKNKIKSATLVVTVLTAALAVAVVVFPGNAQSQSLDSKYRPSPLEPVRDVADLPPLATLLPDRQADAVPGLDSALARLAKVYTEKGETSAREFARKRNIPMNGNKVKVVLNARPMYNHVRAADGPESIDPGTRKEAVERSVARIRGNVERMGGVVDRQYHFMMRVEVSPDQLEQLAQMPEVRGVRRPIKARPHAVSEGVALVGANQYHDLPPYKSGGSKVMVLDGGFEHYTDMLGVDLPDSVTARSFTDELDLEEGGVHGTACAEIVYDMAPDADMYIAQIYWNTDVPDAIEWAVNQGVDVISYSMGSYFGAGDGTGSFDLMAREAKSAGVTWVTSSGNAANDHWRGVFNDPDGDGWHNFDGEDEILHFWVPASLGQTYGVEATLKWNEWGGWSDQIGYGGTNEDFDLYLYFWDGEDWIFVDSSTSRQDPSSYPWPYEDIWGWYAETDAYWGVAIAKHNATKNVTFDLFIPTHTRDTLEYADPSHSLSFPADSPNIISVGAIDAVETYYHYYSSQGPTADGRVKPDLTAPSGVTTSGYTYGLRENDGFAGTSASCPHVAGAIALLKGKTPFTLDEIIQIIYGRVIDMGEPGPDNIFGKGRLNLRQ